MIGMPKPGQVLTVPEAAVSLREMVETMRNYPLGQPVDVTVTLSDEQWIAVCAALGAMVVHNAVEGSPSVFPAWMDAKQREALETIYHANVMGIGGKP